LLTNSSTREFHALPTACSNNLATAVLLSGESQFFQTVFGNSAQQMLPTKRTTAQFRALRFRARRFVDGSCLTKARAFVMRRREIITLLSGAAVALPFIARAQQADTARRIGVLMAFAEEDSESERIRPVAAALRVS
jgi:hypothetical protein